MTTRGESGRSGAALSPAPALLRPLARLVEPVYLAELGRRNRRFDRGEGVTRLGRPVISVGNISVGGVGKTPMVMTIVGWLLEEGVRPCIAMRGYRGHKGAGGSDEAALYRERFGGVPVVAQPDRLAGLRELFVQENVGVAQERGGAEGAGDHGGHAGAESPSSPEGSGLQGRRVANPPHSFVSERAPVAGGPPAMRTDCVVLDDGFQHRRIARDLDLVLIDASRDPFADRALPAGWLREPVASLARADAVVLTHAEAAGDEAVERIGARVAEIRGEGPVAVTAHRWQRLRVVRADGGDRVERPAWLVGKRVVVGCAIGNPPAFVAAAREAVGDGGAVAGGLVLRDHDPWGPKAVSRLLALARAHRAEAIVVTAKDWTKLSGVERIRWPAPVVVAELGMEFVRGEEALRGMVLAAAKELRSRARDDDARAR